MKGPSIGQDVFIVLPSAGPLNGRVDGEQDGSLLLTVWQDQDTRMAQLAGEASLQFTNRRGVCRLDGLMRGYDREFDRIRFDASADVRVIQRRDYARVDAVVSVTYQGRSGRFVDTHTTNVSGGGFLIASPEDVAMGDSLHFTLHIPEGQEVRPLDVFGQAVRKTDGGALGIVIKEISPLDRERLVRFVFDRERLSRQLTRDR